MNRHPARRALRQWTAGERDDVGAHVVACPSCLDRLEELTQLSPKAQRALALVTHAEPGLVDRIETAIMSRRRNHDTWAAALDLFSLGWRTIDTLTEPDD